MRTWAEISATARKPAAFSNGTSWEIWSAGWCCRCKHDDWSGKTEGCPINGVAIIDQTTPTEWMPTGRIQDYECIEFDEKGKRGGGGEPRPKPEPPLMDGLFERPERHVRMLKQPTYEEVNA